MTSTNLDDEDVSTGGENDSTPRPKISEWQIDESSESFHATIISRDEAVFREITYLHEKAIIFIWRVVIYGIQNCPTAVSAVAGIRRPDIYMLRNVHIAVFETISLDPIDHQKTRFTIMTFKDYGDSTSQDFFTKLNNKAFWRLISSPQKMILFDKQPTKDDTCIAAFLFGIKTWDKHIGEQLERFIQRDVPFTEVTIKLF